MKKKFKTTIFDIKKLIWFNQEYIKNMDSEELLPFVTSSISRKWVITIPIIDLIKESVETLNDFHSKASIFFEYTPLIVDKNNELFPLEIYNFIGGIFSPVFKQS